MIKSYRYPPDEFDDVPEDAPTGVHRVPRSPWRKVVPFVVVAVVFAVVAYGGVTLASNLLSSDDASASDQSTSATKGSTTKPTTKSTSKATTKAEASDPATDDEADGDDTAASGDVDLATSIDVKNGTKIIGLAARGAAKVKGAGFTAVGAHDYKGAALSDSVVYYVDDADAATAKKVASVLGISDVEQVSALKDGTPVVAVLLHDLS